MHDMEQYLLSALEGFKNDPADSDYQRGYEAALKATLEYLRDLPPE